MLSQFRDAIATRASADQNCPVLSKAAHHSDKSHIRNSCCSLKQTILRAQNRLYRLWIVGIVILMLVTVTSVVTTVSKSAIHIQKRALYSRVHAVDSARQSLQAMVNIP